MTLRTHLYKHSPYTGTKFKHLAAQHILNYALQSQPMPQSINHVYDTTGKRLNIDTLIKRDPKI